MTPTDVALVTLLGLIATGLWWLGAFLAEKEKRETERRAHEMQVELQRRVHALKVEEMERRSYLRKRNIALETIAHGERLEMQGKAIMELASEIRDEVDPDEPWKGH